MEGQLAALDLKLADVKGRLEHLVDLAEQGGQAKSIVNRINKLELDEVQLEATTLELQQQISNEEAKYQLQAHASEDIEVLLERLANPPADQVFQLRLRLRDHIRSLIAQIDVDLIEKEITVYYVGPLATTKSRLIANNQSSVFVMERSHSGSRTRHPTTTTITLKAGTGLRQSHAWVGVYWITSRTSIATARIALRGLGQLHALTDPASPELLFYEGQCPFKRKV